MKKKETVTTRSSQPNTSEQQHGIGVVELFFTIATLGAAVIIAATRGPKIPPAAND